MTPTFLGPPEWAEARTLPVGDLAVEEREHLEERWRPSRLAAEWSGHRALQRVLLRERMTVEQFAGLTLSLGAAFSRSSLPEDTDLRFLLEKGDRQTAHLKRDRRSFASLPEDDRHLVLLQAMWITRRHRAFLLLEVPPENLDLIARHRESLAAALPEEFQKPAFEGITDRLEEQGLPFEELSSSGRDEELDWRKDDAIIGTDPPDGERGE